MKKKRLAVEQLVTNFKQAEPGVLVAELKRTLLDLLVGGLLLGGVFFQVACGSAGSSTGSGGPPPGNPGPSTFTTNFPLTENPISEGGKWINGQVAGIDWKNVRTTTNLAFGTQTTTGGYDDSSAVLNGTWGSNQTASGTVFFAPSSTGEVEVRLRTTITAHSVTGYEINCSQGYTEIVRWNGALGDFTILVHNGSAACVDGDTLKARIITNANGSATITSYINNVQVNQATDNAPLTSGSPGIGMFNQGGADDNSNGLTSFTATDGPTP